MRKNHNLLANGNDLKKIHNEENATKRTHNDRNTSNTSNSRKKKRKLSLKANTNVKDESISRKSGKSKNLKKKLKKIKKKPVTLS